MKPVILLVVLVIFTHADLLGQKQAENITDKNFHKKAKITLINQQSYTIKDVFIEGDSLCFLSKRTKHKEIVAISSIEQLKIKKGTRVIGGAIIGAVIPTIFILGSLLDNTPNADNAGAIAAGVIGGGAIVGAAIGFSIPVWEIYHFEENQKTALSIDYKIQANSEMVSTGLVLKF